jgi:hypothetical protein
MRPSGGAEEAYVEVEQHSAIQVLLLNLQSKKIKIKTIHHKDANIAPPYISGECFQEVSTTWHLGNELGEPLLLLFQKR